MEEWKECTIGDVCNTISDTYRGNAKDVVLINTSDVLEGKCLNHQKTPNKNLKGQFKKTFQQGDILYSEIRPANKRYAYVNFAPKDYIASTKLMVIRHNDKITPQYLFYILTNDVIIRELQMIAESRSGTFPQVTFSELANFSISLPSISQQKEIVAVLKSFDSKIDLNRRINDNLEQQAQALFKSWFVNFEPFKNGQFVDSELGKIPKGWKVGYLSEIADIIMGQSPNGSTYNENGEGIIFYQGRAEFGTRFPSIRLFTTNPTRIAPANSILISVRAPVGDINITHKECCIGRGLASAVSRTNKSAFLLYTLFSLKSDLDRFNAEGTVFGSINRKTLESLKILIPTNDIISKFEAIVASMDQQILTLHLESENLKILRDTLLPKLMSGERSVIHKENNDD